MVIKEIGEDENIDYIESYETKQVTKVMKKCGGLRLWNINDGRCVMRSPQDLFAEHNCAPIKLFSF